MAPEIIMPPTKLHGRAFYESIGSPKFILAPMVDQSEFAWRVLTRSFMTPESNKSMLAYTPMFHARMFGETPKFRDNHFQPARASLATKPNGNSPKYNKLHLDGNPAFDRPLFVQFCANNPIELLDSAEYVAPFCDAVDLNLGCPQGIARKGGYGAFLQENQDLIYDLINKLHKELSVPVTAKIRILETKEMTLKYARKVLSAGASILTVHGRQREQKGHKTGLADWSVIRYLRENLPRETVLFANGNILRRRDIDDCLAATGADGVMSAEGNLYDPTIFGEAPEYGNEGREYWRGVDGNGGYRVDAVFRRYMDIIYKYVLEVPPPVRTPLFLPSDLDSNSSAALEHNLTDESTHIAKDLVPGSMPAVQNGTKRGREEDDMEETSKRQKKKQQKQKSKAERTSNPNLIAMQPHCFHMLRPLVKRHHHIRDALGRCRAGDVPAFEAVLQMTEQVVKEALIQNAADGGESIRREMEEDERALLKGGPDDAATETASAPTNGRGPTNGDTDSIANEAHAANMTAYESSVETVRDCRRPWWVLQPYVRPLPAEALQNGALRLNKKQLKELEAKNSNMPGIETGKVVQETTREGDVVDVPRDGLLAG